MVVVGRAYELGLGGLGGFWVHEDRAWAPLQWLQKWRSLHELAVHPKSLRLLQTMLLPQNKTGRPRRSVVLL